MYLVESQALAALEILVHVEEVELMPVYVVVEVIIPPEFVLDLDDNLAGETLHLADVDATAVLGSRWADSMDSLALRVPSRVIPGESNFVLNPRHESISEVTHSEPRPFQFDPRLLR